MQNSYMQACTKPVSESYSTQRRCVTAATVVSHTTDFQLDIHVVHATRTASLRIFGENQLNNWLCLVGLVY